MEREKRLKSDRNMNKHPEYIKRFMNKTKPRGVNIKQLREEVNNKKLDQYYSYLSDMHHANPVCIKMTYYRIDDRIDKSNISDKVITFKPLDFIDKYAAVLDSLCTLYLIALFDIKLIFSKKWKKEIKSYINLTHVNPNIYNNVIKIILLHKVCRTDSFTGYQKES